MKKVIGIGIVFLVGVLLGFMIGRDSQSPARRTSFFYSTDGGLAPEAPVIVYAMAECDAERFLSEREPFAHLDIDLSFGSGYSLTISGDVGDGVAEAVRLHFEDRLAYYLREYQQELRASNPLLPAVP